MAFSSSSPLLSKLTLRHILLLAVFATLFAPMYLTIHLLTSRGASITDRRPVIHRHMVRSSVSDEELQAYWDAKPSCRFHTCFEINNCSVVRGDQIEVYVYPETDFVSEETNKDIALFKSVEYQELVDAVRGSRYYQSKASRACVFIPGVDTMSEDIVDERDMSLVLHSLPHWSGGSNHLIFSMLPGSYPDYNTVPDFYYGKAMVAGGGFFLASYRQGYDLSIPVFNYLTRSQELHSSSYTSLRTRLLTVLSPGKDQMPNSFREKLLDLERSYDALLLEPCPPGKRVSADMALRRCRVSSNAVVSYPSVLLGSKFCLLVPGVRYGSPDFTDAMMTGCIPVVIDDDYVLPFSEVLDWTRASIRVWQGLWEEGMNRLRDYPGNSVFTMREQVLFLYRRYFFSMATIVNTVLDIVNERVFPTTVHGYEHWNNQPYNPTLTNRMQFNYPLPLGLPAPPPTDGFTAVILAYDRIEMLFKVIQSVSKAPSLVKVLVVWNNVKKLPPPAEEWPRIKQRIQVIRSKENKLSNRFYPYPEIQTACILAVDDDITMITADELEFGYKAWQEFPNRLVGFPGRVHVRDYKTQKWKYESEWLNNISLVLTGAAFYHKFYHFQYTHIMPQSIRQWVDVHMNCEDIAMNFLIANYSGLPPMKVSPRKKFTCPSCTSEESLWSDPQHYLERNECINVFQGFFKSIPLETVKFRLDPVLYKIEGAPNRYPDIGEL